MKIFYEGQNNFQEKIIRSHFNANATIYAAYHRKRYRKKVTFAG